MVHSTGTEALTFQKLRFLSSLPATGEAWDFTDGVTSRDTIAPPQNRNGYRSMAVTTATLSTSPKGKALQREFFDHFLKGEDNGWDKRPPVMLKIRYPGEVFIGRTEMSGPSAEPSGQNSTSTQRA